MSSSLRFELNTSWLVVVGLGVWAGTILFCFLWDWAVESCGAVEGSSYGPLVIRASSCDVIIVPSAMAALIAGVSSFCAPSIIMVLPFASLSLAFNESSQDARGKF